VAVLTLADVLAMPVLRGASPEVVAGHRGLGRQVRWVHSAELADIAPLLREGDLLLSTGIAMPDTGPELAAFAQSLAAGGVVGLVLELGRRWADIPSALVRACEELGLPLVALTREVRFAAVAQVVGERIVDEQLGELREAQRVHDTFTELSISEAEPSEILAAVQRMSGATVVLEGEQHQVLDYRAGPDDVGSVLAGWTSRSRAVHVDGRTGWDEATGWLVTRVGRRERGWGRLVVQSATSPTPGLVAVAERAAAALALHRLHDRQRDSLVRRTHHEVLLALLADPLSEDAVRRCELAGVPLTGRRLVGLSLRPRVSDGSADALISAVVLAADRVGVPALVCEVERDVRVLLSLPSATSDDLVEDLARRVQERHEVLLAAGRGVGRTSEVDRTLRESQHVLEAVGERSPPRTVHRLEDVHLRGLLTLLADDDRLALYVARELDPLREHDAAHGTELLAAVRALVEHPTSKSAAAAALHLSRPVFYDRLARAARVLGADLDDPHTRVSLHVALVADDVARSRS
jgi:purine catabolism regulator